jgi:ferredoxin-NADP reductase
MVRWAALHERGTQGLAGSRSVRLPVEGAPRRRARVAWFAAAGVVNGLVLVVAGASGPVVYHAVEASLAAFCLAVAARHDGIVRQAFVLGRLVPSYAVHQLTYHLGQFHRAMALAGTAWFVVAIAAAVTARPVALAVLAVLLAMTWTARDLVRQDHHDRFEIVHRLGGWAALAVLAVLVLHAAVTSAPAGTGPAAVLARPSVVLLVVLLVLVVHPWLGVRRLPVEVLTVTDDVVVLALPGRHRPGEFVRVSREGRQWHSFAVATTGIERAGEYCLVIRRAGDWTDELARDVERGCAPPTLLVRRMRGYGFMYHAQAREKVLFVATGAGIGPVLPYLVGPPAVEHECLWIGRDHRRMMGDALVDHAVAGGHVTLVDTRAGRPDVGACVAALARRFDAVFVVSNEKVRDQVARVCEELAVPWYGPTFDS